MTLEHGGNGAIANVTVGIQLEHNVLSIVNPSCHGSLQVINHGLDGFPIGVVFSVMVLVLLIHCVLATRGISTGDIANHKAGVDAPAAFEELGNPTAKTFWIHSVFNTAIHILVEGMEEAATILALVNRIHRCVVSKAGFHGMEGAGFAALVEALLRRDESPVDTDFVAAANVGVVSGEGLEVRLVLVMWEMLHGEKVNIAENSTLTILEFDLRVVSIVFIIVKHGNVSVQGKLFEVTSGWGRGSPRGFLGSFRFMLFLSVGGDGM